MSVRDGREGTECACVQKNVCQVEIHEETKNYKYNSSFRPYFNTPTWADNYKYTQ